MSQSTLRPAPIIVPVVLMIGVVTGFLVRPTVSKLLSGLHAEHSVDEYIDDHDIDVHENEHEEPHVALTQQAYQNLGLSIAPVKLSDYTQTIRMPGEIQESPGFSVQQVAAPVSGTLSRLFASPGIAVTEGTPLFELAIIDDDLMKAQLSLLELITKREIVDAELKRLTPLASTGTVAGKKLLEWQYQNKEVVASLARTRQELAMRGLSVKQIERIVTSEETISSMTVRAPALSAAAPDDIQKPGDRSDEIQRVAWLQSLKGQSDLTVEELLVDAGQSIKRGQPVCILAAHGMLHVCGHAFENEVSVVSKLMNENEPVGIEFGIEGYCTSCTDLTIQYIDSHVDPQTQTYRFFIPLPNNVVSESTDSLGRRFRTWRYKVGQRVHALIPEREIQGHIALPRDAVVQDGPDAFVFRQHDEHEHAPDLAEEHEDLHSDVDEYRHDEVFLELEPVAVTVIHRDKSVAIVAANEELQVGDRVAMGSAYQLLLAMKADQDEGGGHHHHH